MNSNEETVAVEKELKSFYFPFPDRASFEAGESRQNVSINLDRRPINRSHFRDAINGRKLMARIEG